MPLLFTYIHVRARIETFRKSIVSFFLICLRYIVWLHAPSLSTINHSLVSAPTSIPYTQLYIACFGEIRQNGLSFYKSLTRVSLFSLFLVRSFGLSWRRLLWFSHCFLSYHINKNNTNENNIRCVTYTPLYRWRYFMSAYYSF